MSKPIRHRLLVKNKIFFYYRGVTLEEMPDKLYVVLVRRPVKCGEIFKLENRVKAGKDY
ncbi:MAG TPA: hypothetical protein VGO45_12205 [Bacteroidia bacterium]|nr:hypothetical protein [Bacteroidia bacterium]